MNKFLSRAKESLASALFLSLVIIVVSCNEDESVYNLNSSLNNKTQLEDAFLINDPFGYTKYNLEKIGKGVLLTAHQEHDFKKFIYTEVEKQFDGDYNVLIKRIINSSKIWNISLRDNINKLYFNKSARSSADVALEAFKNINGNSYYPQIYIPFYEELKSKNKIGKKAPILVAYDGNSSKKEEEGYVLNYKNEFVKLPNMVDEAYAKENEVWILSINDRVESIEKSKEKKSSNRLATGNPEGRIVKLNIKDAKEGWQSGKSDIRIEGIYTNGYPQYSSNALIGGYNGELDTWSRRWLGHARDYDIKITYVYEPWGSWTWIKDFNVPYHYSGPTPYLCYVLYEHDNWPESIKTQQFTFTEGVIEIGYRSAESPYIWQITVPSRQHPWSTYGYMHENAQAMIEMNVY